MTTVVDLIKKLRPNIKEKTLKNYTSAYNVCRKYFKDIEYFKKPKEVIKFYKDRYPKITTRKTNLHAQALIARAYNHLGSERIFLKEAKSIEETLNKEKEKKLEAVLKNPPPKKFNASNEVLNDFDLVNQTLQKQESLVMDFYNPKKKEYTIKQLKDISKLAIMALYASSFNEKDLYLAKNPPRRLEYRFLKYHEGRFLKKDIDPEFNYLIRPNKRLKLYKFMFNKYKATALKTHGRQTIICNSRLSRILFIYIKTHTKLLEKNGLLFPQNLYNNKDQVVFNDFQWSKKIKKYLGVSVSAIRKAFVTKTYTQPNLPQTVVLEALAKRMGHSLSTALTEYRQIPKQI